MHVPRTEIVVTVAVLGLAGIGVAAGAVGYGGDAHEGRRPATEKFDEGDEQAMERYYGPECGEEISDGTHGDYVRRAAHDPEGDVRAVAHSDCGKPLSSVRSKPAQGGPKDHPHGGPPGQAKEKGMPAKP